MGGVRGRGGGENARCRHFEVPDMEMQAANIFFLAFFLQLFIFLNNDWVSLSTLCFQSVKNQAGSRVSILSGSEKYVIYFLCLLQTFQKEKNPNKA